MKLLTYTRNKAVHCGILSGVGIADVGRLWDDVNPPHSVKEILERGPKCMLRLAEALAGYKDLIPLDLVKVLAPIPLPGKVIGLAGNYGEHIREAGLALGLSESPRKTTVPRPFLMPSTVVTGTGEVIPWPVYSGEIDYEVELGVIIGKKGKCFGPQESLEYIGGYTIVNDVSGRSVSFKGGRVKRPWDEFYDWLNGKWADGFLPMGPWIVTPEEIDDVQNLEIKLEVNGKVRQESNTSEMIYKVTDIVSFLSHIMTLEPGDIIATGTPAGVAMASGKFLEGGDRIDCSIEKLGTLMNTLGQRPEKFYEPLL